MSSRILTAALAALILTPMAVIPASALAQSDPAMAPAAAPSAAMAASPGLVPSGDIYATLKANPHFTILVKALDQAQLTAVISRTPGLTLFAPTDEAFNALPAAQLAALLKTDNADVLQKILIYHLVNARIDAAKIKGAKGPIPSVEKSTLQLDGSGAVLKVNDADIIQPEVAATNGLIQVIDKVLIPSDVTLPAA